MPDGAAFLRVTPVHRIPLLTILSLSHTQFVGLATLLRALVVLIFLSPIPFGLDRATYSFIGVAFRSAVSVSHDCLLRAKWMKREMLQVPPHRWMGTH